MLGKNKIHISSKLHEIILNYPKNKIHQNVFKVIREMIPLLHGDDIYKMLP